MNIVSTRMEWNCTTTEIKLIQTKMCTKFILSKPENDHEYFSIQTISSPTIVHIVSPKKLHGSPAKGYRFQFCDTFMEHSAI